MGAAQLPEGLVLAPAEALAEADRLLAADRPFAAHEVLEGVWKGAPPAERALWQGLAQLAVGLTHAQRGNAEGAARLLRRGAERIGPYAARPPHGVPVAELAVAAGELADRVAADGVAGVLAEDGRRPLRLRLGPD